MLKMQTDLVESVRAFILRQAEAARVEPLDNARSHPLWKRLGELGTQLWLDTGDMDDADATWTPEFAALTTNNSLLNKEVQKGAYDQVIPQAAEMLAPFELSDQQRMLELAFILNAVHALKLVKRYGAYVSVEEHTDLAHDPDAAVEYARRYYALCPERFIIKIPFTPAGVLATRRLTDEGIPVNHTLGFAARQNYVIARIARPTYVNVFMGRLNSFVADNGLGSGDRVGERATLASQAVVRGLRDAGLSATGQIGASFRSGEQIRDLAGIDVMTFPPKAARGFLELGLAPGKLEKRTGAEYEPGIEPGVDPAEVGLPTLWDTGQAVVDCLNDLDRDDVDSWTPGDLVGFFADHGCGDLMVDWTDEEVARSAEEGKIPKLSNWRENLAGGRIGLDALMNLAGLNAFIADQRAMDDHVRQTLRNNGSYRSE